MKRAPLLFGPNPLFPAAASTRRPVEIRIALSTTGVALQLGLSKRRVLHLIYSGALPAFRVGKRLRVDRDVVDAWKAAQR